MCAIDRITRATACISGSIVSRITATACAMDGSEVGAAKVRQSRGLVHIIPEGTEPRKYRVAMTNRSGHGPTEESNEQLYRFFEYFLK